MERNDFNPVSEKNKQPGHVLTSPSRQGTSLLHSARLKLLVFCGLLLGYGVLVSLLFTGNTRAFIRDTGAVSSLRSDYYLGYSSLARVHTNLKNYVTYVNDDYRQAYQESRLDLEGFIRFLADSGLGPDSRNFGLLCQRYLESADSTIEIREHSPGSETEDLLTSLDGTEHLYALAVSYTAYSMNEMEAFVNDQMVTLNQQASHRLSRNVTILIVITVGISLLALLFVIYFLRPLEKLTALVNHTSTETWQIKEPPLTRRDEMGLLYRAFYEMMNKNRTQYNELRARQQLEIQLQKEHEKTIRAEATVAKTRLKVFQSQINSHFLFNTLNIISRLAYLERAPRVQNASNLLAQFLRSVLGQFNRIVTLEEEFDTMDSYIEIQKLRFQDRIAFESTLDPDLACAKIPSVTMQPLVENAVIHGVSMEPCGFVRCSALLEGRDALLTVYDDGRGMSPLEAKGLMERLTADKDAIEEQDLSHGLGLINVYQRLCLYYPGRVTPIVESVEGEFCRMGFRISDILD